MDDCEDDDAECAFTCGMEGIEDQVSILFRLLFLFKYWETINYLYFSF